MSRARCLAKAVTARRPFFTGRFDDVILDDGRIAVLPVAVLSLANRQFVDFLFERIPQSRWIPFRLGGAVATGPEQEAFMDALMRLWREDGKHAAELEAIGDELLNQFIKLLTTRAPGALGREFLKRGVRFRTEPT